RSVYGDQGSHRRLRDTRDRVPRGSAAHPERVHGAAPEVLAGIRGRVRAAADVRTRRGTALPEMTSHAPDHPMPRAVWVLGLVSMVFENCPEVIQRALPRLPLARV